MPEHDLGTAHGRIEIDTDIDGVGSTIAQMAALSAVIKGLEGPVQKLDSAMDSVAEATGTFSKVIAKTTEAASSLGGTLGDLAGQVAEITGLTGLLDTAMQKTAAGLASAGQAGWKVYGIFQALKDPIGTLRSVFQTLGYNLFGINKELANFPQWTKTIMKLSGAVAAVGLAASTTAKVFSLAGKTIFGAITNNAHATSLMIKVLSAGSKIAKGFVPALVAIAGKSVFTSMALMKLGLGMSALYNNSGILGKSLRALGNEIKSRGGTIRAAYKNISQLTGGLSKMVVGAALATSGLKSLAKVFSLIKSPQGIIGMVAALAGIVAIGPVASVLLGVVDALKQLSGAALILPGALAALLPAAGVLMVAFKGVGGAFSAAALEGEEFEKALEDLSPGMQNVARAAHGFKDEFKDLKRIIEEGVWHGMSRNIKQLGGTYMPMLRIGTEKVAAALNEVFISFTDFAKSGRTVADFNELMGISARTTSNLGKAFHPIMAILRDVGMVGAQVFEELTRGAGKTTQGWADFISKAKESGELRTWIQDGIQGLRDLKNTIRDISVGIGDMFRGLGGNGDNALERMADSAARFREAMDGGHSNSGFASFARVVEDVSGRVRDLISVMVEGLGHALESTAKLAANFGKGFLDGFTGVIAAATGLIAVVSSIMSAFAPLGEVIGLIAGIALAFKGLLLILGPVIAIMKILFGMGMMAKGFQSAMMAAALAVEKVGLKAGASAATVGRLTGAMTALAAAASAAMAGLMVVIGVFMAWSAATEATKKSNDNMASSAENAKIAYDDLVGAFTKSRGAVDNGVIDSMADSLATLRNDLETTEDTTTGFMADLGAAFQDSFSGSWDKMWGGESSANKNNNRIDEMSRMAERANTSFGELQKSNKELAKDVTGTDEAFARLVLSLQQTSNGGVDAINEITQKRAEFLEIKEAMEAVGPAGIVVSEGLALIADESSTATDKLNGLMNVMRGLGLIETTAQEAAMALSESIAEVAKEAEDQVNVDASMGMNLVDDQGWLKNTEENGRALYSILKGLRDELAIVASEGGNVQASFDEMWPQLVKVGESFGFTEAEMGKLIERYGFVPDKIETIMSVTGKEKAQEDLTRIMLLAQQAGAEPIEKTVKLETEEAKNALQQMGVEVENWNPRTGTAEVTIPPGLGPEVVKRIQEVLDGASLVTPPTITPVVEEPNRPEGFVGPVQEFVGPVLDPGAAAEIERLKAEAAEPIKPVIAPPDVTPITAALAEVQTQFDAVSAKPIEITAGGTEQVTAAVDAVKSTLEAVPNDVNVSVSETGALAVYEALVMVGVGAETAWIKFETFVTILADGITTAMDMLSMFAMTVENVLGGAAAGAYDSGAALGQGFADGISSKAAAVQAAALQLAEAASAPLPRSPAKIGPFSGRGWTPFRGMSLAEGFAQGILAGTPLAQSATLNMASAISDVMDNIRSQFDMPVTAFSANKFGDGITNYYRDTEITDKQLSTARKEREDQERKDRRLAALEAQQSAADSLPDAEDRVLSARDRVVKAEERIAKAEETLGKAKKSDAIQDANENLADAKDALVEARIAESEAITERDKARSLAGGASPTGVEGGLSANRERTDYAEAMFEIAKTFGLEMTSDDRPGEANWHGAGRAADFSNGQGNTDQQLAFADFMERNFKPYIKELIYDDPRFQGREIKDGNNVDSSFYDGAGDHTNHVHLAVEFAPEFAKGGTNAAPTITGADIADVKTSIDPTRTDLSQDEVASVIIARGKAMGMSDDEIKSALATGLVESNLKNLTYGDRSSVGALQQQDFDEWTKGGARNRMNVDDAATTYYEKLRETEGTPGERAQMVQRSATPDLYGQRMGEADAIFNRLSNSAGTALKVESTGEGDDLNRLRANNKAIDDALRTAEDPDSTDAQIIQAIQTLDASVTGLSELDQELIKVEKDAIMEDRGIKEYDPFEGALETDYDKFKFALQSAQDVLGIFNMLKSGLQNAAQVGKLMVRGISNTNDVHSLVDGIQGMASTVGEIVSAVGTVTNMVATVAATAGAAIPGIGQVGAVVSAVTGGIADVNAVVDLVQDVMKMGGRMFGGMLSSFLGGDNGQLHGNVRTLLDFNDNTMKTWSDRNSAEKSVRPLGGGAQPNNPNSAGGIRDLNIYQGPGGDPRDMMNAAMFAVKAHSGGVFSG